jgi:anti-sigma-K factor RskA
MTDEDDIDGLAAEFVLGSLSPEERQEVEARRKVDRALGDAVDAWEKRLGTLGDRVPGIEPPPELFAKIAHSLWAGESQTIQFAEFASLRVRNRRWRALSIGAGSLAACLTLMVGWLLQNWSPNPTTRPGALVAVLQRSGATTADEGSSAAARPAFVVNVDLKSRSIVVSPVTARAVARRSYELWLMQPGAAPSSLGVISPSEATTVTWRMQNRPDDFVAATLAISVEPEGGSSTGVPTGPIAFVGRLVQP